MGSIRSSPLQCPATDVGRARRTHGTVTGVRLGIAADPGGRPSGTVTGIGEGTGAAGLSGRRVGPTPPAREADGAPLAREPRRPRPRQPAADSLPPAPRPRRP